MTTQTGSLTLVPTPIGNLGDLSPRAVEVLKEADLVLAEDTRTTGNLLRLAEIDRPLRAFHSHNEHKVTQGLVQQLVNGARFALCSDAGTPGISDPGFLLVRACVEAGVHVSCLPGPTAFVPALAASGLPCDRFSFEGFLPHKKGRQKRLAALSELDQTFVLYESPHRILRLLDELSERLGAERQVAVCREISKLHEEIVRGNLSEVANHFAANEPRGEFVVVVAGR
jgi:16S rRNA (cytidine1402-2'-O)-methyltransferase